MEEQKAAIQKEANELRSTLREVEKARLDARRELQELRRQVSALCPQDFLIFNIQINIIPRWPTAFIDDIRIMVAFTHLKCIEVHLDC